MFDCIAVTYIKLCLSNLNLIKWNDKDGRENEFRLVERVSAKWREFGRQIELDENILDGWYKYYLGNAKYCWDKVMQSWLDNGAKDYPKVTWSMLYEMLDDVNYAEVANELRTAVRRAILDKNFCPDGTND